MEKNRCGFTKEGEYRFLIVSMLVLILSPSFILWNMNFAYGQPNRVTFPSLNARISLLLDAQPSFLVCGMKNLYKGESTIPGLDVNSSINEVLTDGNPDTVVGGNARFDVLLGANSSLVNLPGADFIVSEAGGPENFKISVYNSQLSKFSPEREFSVLPTGKTNSCHMGINGRVIDLTDFGIANGASVALLRLDNEGKPGCCYGSEISDIIPMHILNAPSTSVKIPSFIASGNQTTAMKSPFWSLIPSLAMR